MSNSGVKDDFRRWKDDWWLGDAYFLGCVVVALKQLRRPLDGGGEVVGNASKWLACVNLVLYSESL